MKSIVALRQVFCCLNLKSVSEVRSIIVTLILPLFDSTKVKDVRRLATCTTLSDLLSPTVHVGTCNK